MRFDHRLLVLALLAVTVGCDQATTTPSGVVDTSQLPADQVIYGLKHTMTKNGVRSAVLDGDTAYLRNNGQRFDLVGVHLKFYAENGRESGDLTSKTGEYNVNDGFFTARGNVVLVTQGPKASRRLETQELYYNVKGDQLWSDSAFVMTEGSRVTRGSNFRSDSKFETWTVNNPQTTGGLPEPEGGGISF